MAYSVDGDDGSKQQTPGPLAASQHHGETEKELAMSRSAKHKQWPPFPIACSPENLLREASINPFQRGVPMTQVPTMKPLKVSITSTWP